MTGKQLKEYHKRLVDLQKEIANHCTKSGINCNIITSIQIGNINAFPQVNNSRELKDRYTQQN